MSDDQGTAPPPEPDPAPNEEWPPDHVPAEPLAPPPDMPDNVDPPVTPLPPPDQTLYDIWEGDHASPPNWAKMTGAENTGLLYDAVTERCMVLEGFAVGDPVPHDFVSHHVGVVQGRNWPPA